jgi:hypothetical protein
MWLCLNRAFLSVVEPQPGSPCLLVRARRRGDIEAVFGKNYQVEERPERDYLFRALIPRQVVAEVIAAEVGTIDYPNFKDSVSDHKLHDAYAAVWRIMARLQPTPPYSGRGAARQKGLL